MMKECSKRYLAISAIVVLLIGLSSYFIYRAAMHESTDSKLEALKPNIVKELNQRYHEKFKVIKGKYNAQSKTYSFIVETDSMPDEQFTVITDLMGKGAFVSNFLQTRQAIESAKLVESYFKGVARDYKAVAGGVSISPLELPEAQRYLSAVALDNLHGQALHLNEWIKTSHQAMIFGGTIKINIKETPQNILKVLEVVYQLNHYFLSKDFFGYGIDVQLMDLPEKPQFVTFPLSYEIFARQQGWETNKYTWATISISNCTPNGVKKTCGDKPNIPEYAYIGKSIKSPLDVAQYFKFIPRRPAKYDSLIYGEQDSWVITRRAKFSDSKWLIDTPMYQQIKDIYNKDNKQQENNHG
ncbi:hypothetical protein [Cysteiniphilum sp. SYW-8]|nr:hypothetical protein [Cysteiniphilum sp. SYW-8]